MAAKILIAGDICLHDRTAHLSLDELYESHRCIDIHGWQCDYAIVNLESAISDTDNVSSIAKSGPALRSSSDLVALISKLGFNCVTLANNHFSDYGEATIKNSIGVLLNQHLDYVGGGLNISEAKQVLYKNIKGTKIAIINVCEHEFTIADENKAGVNPLSLISQYYDIQEAKNNADYVIVIIHGGIEHYPLPSPRMQETYHFFIDAGADAVINHHQHCYSGCELYKNKPIFYGLGNLSFDWNGKRNENWNEGYMVQLNLDEQISFSLIPYIQGDESVGIRLMNQEERELFNQTIQELNDIIANPQELQKHFEQIAFTRKDEYLKPFVIKYHKWVKRICKLIPSLRRILMPKYLTSIRKLILLNYIQNESHSELLTTLLRNEKY